MRGARTATPNTAFASIAATTVARFTSPTAKNGTGNPVGPTTNEDRTVGKHDRQPPKADVSTETPEQRAQRDAFAMKAAEETAKMGKADKIIYWDKRQHDDNPEAIRCGHDPKHGVLQMAGNGATLVCPSVKNGAACTFNMPVSL